MGSEEGEGENGVAYWQNRAREALESRGVVLPDRRRRRHTRQPAPRNPWTETPPPGVVSVRLRTARVGLDLICNTCHAHAPRFQLYTIVCHFYSPTGPQGSALTRCYVSCPNCLVEWVLGRNIGDEDKFAPIEGATQEVPVAENVTESNHNIQNEAYPDAVLDLPNDFGPRPSKYVKVSPTKYVMVRGDYPQT